MEERLQRLLVGGLKCIAPEGDPDGSSINGSGSGVSSSKRPREE